MSLNKNFCFCCDSDRSVSHFTSKLWSMIHTVSGAWLIRDWFHSLKYLVFSCHYMSCTTITEDKNVLRVSLIICLHESFIISIWSCIGPSTYTIFSFWYPFILNPCVMMVPGESRCQKSLNILYLSVHSANSFYKDCNLKDFVFNSSCQPTSLSDSHSDIHPHIFIHPSIDPLYHM